MFVDSANQGFIELCTNISKYGVVCNPRNQTVVDLVGSTLTIQEPWRNIISIPERKISRKYLAHEFIWYCSADRKSDYIGKHAKFWKTITNDDGTLNSNYGYYMFSKMPHAENNQFEYCLNLLKNDKDSRQAVININRVEHKKHLKDTPCTLGLQYIIRNNELMLIVMMRSCDIVLGYCNDVFQFSMFQLLMLNELKKTYPDLQCGKMVWHANSFHYYERHQQMVHDVISKYENKFVTCHNEHVKSLDNICYSDVFFLQEYYKNNNLAPVSNASKAIVHMSCDK